MRSITEDILEWSEKYLEPKNEHLGNVPVCPYARTARLKKTYRILECKKFVNFQDAIIGGAKIAKDDRSASAKMTLSGADTWSKPIWPPAYFGVSNQIITEILTVNGVRFSFEDGSWGLIRASSNKPSLVIVTESPKSDLRKKKIFEFIDTLLKKTGKIGEYDQKI